MLSMCALAIVSGGCRDDSLGWHTEFTDGKKVIAVNPVNGIVVFDTSVRLSIVDSCVMLKSANASVPIENSLAVWEVDADLNVKKRMELSREQLSRAKRFVLENPRNPLRLMDLYRAIGIEGT